MAEQRFHHHETEEEPLYHVHSHGNGHSHVHANTKAVLNRLSRAIGHLESVRQMVEDGRDCSEVLIQLAAVKSAINGVGKVILKDRKTEKIHLANFGQTWYIDLDTKGVVRIPIFGVLQRSSSRRKAGRCG